MTSDDRARERRLEFSLSLLEQLHVGVIANLSNNPSAPMDLYANYAAQRLLGFSDAHPSIDDIAALNFQIDSELIGAPDQKQPLQHPLTQALQGESTERRDLVFQNKAIAIRGEQVSASSGVYHAVLLFERDHRLFVQNRHAGDLLTSEISLKDMISFDKLMSQLSTALINAQGSAAYPHIQKALEALGEFCQSDRTYIFEFDSDVSEMSNTFEWVRDGITSHIDELQHIPRHALPWFFESLEHEGLFLVHQLEDIPERGQAEQAEFEKEDIRSVICIGMYAQQKLIGAVGCDMVARSRFWTEADIRRLKLVGEMIANAIQSERFINDLKQAQRELLTTNSQLHDLAHLDALTGIANRRQFDHVLNEEIGRAIRHGYPLALCLVDIDHFKAFNDAYGHLAGDQVLKQVAQLLQNHFRRSGELVARFGGEEFAILIPNKGIVDIESRVADVFEALHGLNIGHNANPVAPYLTMSAGLVDSFQLSEPTAEQLTESADRALYQAKSAGRNRYHVFQ